MTIAEKLVTIAENEPKIYNKGYLDASPQETVSGEAIGITDISPIEHNMGVSVRGENLFKTTNYTKGTINSSTGVAGEGSAQRAFALTTDFIYLKSGAYVVSNVVGANLRFVAFYDLNKGFKSATWTNRAKTFNFTITEACYVRIDVERDANATIDNFDTFLTEYEFMMNEGTTSTSYAPYIADISNVKLLKQGKNWFKKDTSLVKEITYYNASGTEYIRYGYEISLPVGTYTIKAYDKRNPNDTYSYYIYGVVCDKNNIVVKSGLNTVVNNDFRIANININDGEKFLLYDGENSSLTVSSNKLSQFDFQLEIGETPTEYEPYIEPTIYDVSADGTVEGVKSIYPNTTLYTDTSGAVIDCTYYQDGKKVKENLIDLILSLGGVINE